MVVSLLQHSECSRKDSAIGKPELTLDGAVAETRVQVVGDLAEEGGGHLLALVVEEVHLD